MSSPQHVALLGASTKTHRYAFKAFNLLQEYGHHVYPINPSLDTINNQKVYSSLLNLPEPIDTLTLYLNPKKLLPLINDIIQLNPKRVIFNPGTESEEVMQALKNKHIPYEEACTLVLLRTQQFDLE